MIGAKKSKGFGFGYGKTIFFGEHFVVHGLPAIVCALGFKTEATIEELGGSVLSKKNFELVDFRPKVPTFNPALTEKYRISIVENILKISGVTKKVKITLSGDLTVCSGGIGASAAFASSLARAISDFYDFKWDEQKINQVAYEGERGAHGTPSGIDNTAAVFGGAFCFYRNLEQVGKYFVDPIKLQHPIEIVLADSGIVGGTEKVVEFVRFFLNSNPQQKERIFAEYKNLFQDAKKVVAEFDLKKIGLLMNKNQELLSEIGVSCSKLDEMINVARSAGALGAKLTGTGKGGLVLALTPGEELQKSVANELNRAGFFTLKTTVG